MSVQCDDVLMLKELVKSSDVLCLATWDVVAADVQAGRLAVLPWPNGEVAGRGSAYALVRHAGRSLSPAASQFVELLLEEDAAFNAAS